MSSYGVIFTGFGTKEYIHQSLAPWVALRREAHENGDHLYICAVSVKFAGFEGEDDGTREILREYLARGEIDHLIDGPDNISERVARGMAMRHLLDNGVTYIWQVDSDEPYTQDEIVRIKTHVESHPWIIWWRLCLKNYVFDDKTYLADPFTPPRIHQVRSGSYKVHSFSGDNDIQYGGTITRDIIPQDRFASGTVPPTVAWIRHESWPNSLRSKKKIEYQTKGRGWAQCQFAWDDSKGGLIFNPSLPAPKISQIKP